MSSRFQLRLPTQPTHNRRLSAIPLLLLLFVLGPLAGFAEKIADIRPAGYVTDLAGVVAAPTKARLEALCAEVERKTGAQVAVVTVNSLEGESVENYAVDLFKHLGVGHKDNRGVLLLLAPRDRRYRVEVGYGLEPVINDARAGDVGRAMLPTLRQGDYGGAVALGVNQLAAFIANASNVKLQTEPIRVAPRRPPEPRFPWWILLLGIPAVPFLLRSMRPSPVAGRRGRGAGSGIWWIGPGGFGGGGWGGGGGGGFGGGFGGFGGGESGGGGASGSW
jgi:uncharacterized protein